jgi:hypothetical protein
MKKALVFIDFDMLVRHFVLARAFRELEKSWRVRYVFHADSRSNKRSINIDPATLGLRDWIEIEVPRRRMGMWDHLYCVTALRNQRGTTNEEQKYQQIYSTRNKKFVPIYRILSRQPFFSIFRYLFIRYQGIDPAVDRLIADERPDVVLHPSILTGHFINDLQQACNRRSIPLVLLMNSWDNPSTKAMNAGVPDRLVVWGPQTRRHAIEFMKMPPERVVEFGAAQFDVYREPIAEGDAELRRMFGVPPDLPVLLYAGVSKSVDETAHLIAIERAIADGRIPPCHVIYRPHPWRGGLVEGERNFFDVGFRHVVMDPFMSDYYRRVAATPDRVFDMADYRITARLLRLVSGVISPLSTMLLEAVMHGLPVIMFYPSETPGAAFDTIELGRKLPHFAEFWGPEGIAICSDSAKLPEACREMLTTHQRQSVRDELRMHARKFAVMDGPSYAERLQMLADQLSGPRRAPHAALRRIADDDISLPQAG